MSEHLTPERLAQIRELAMMSGPDSAIAHAVAEIDRLRGEHEADRRTWQSDLTKLREARAERDELKQRLHNAGMTRTWTNEDGKKFVFVEDIAPHLLGSTKSGDAR